MEQHYDNLVKTAHHFGLSSQINKTIEEVDELREALHTPALTAHLQEEIADVYNMLDQLCILMDCEDSVQDIAERKMIRTIEIHGI